MKSSTLNPSLKAEVKQDKRVQALMKEEMLQHQAIISSHHTEMQNLRDLVNDSVINFGNKIYILEQKINEKVAIFHNIICQIQDQQVGQGSILRECKNKITDFKQELDLKINNCATRNDLEKYAKESSAQVKESNINYINNFQYFQTELKATVKNLRDEVSILKQILDNKLSEFNNTLENKNSSMKLDKDDVLKEVRVLGKTIFIIEKNIENLYTQIERINKKGITCPKQD